MATKIELEELRSRYLGLIHEANRSLAINEFPLSISKALEALEFIEGAIQYEKRYLKNESFPHVAFDIIFGNAPTFFLFDALSAVESYLNDSKKIDKTGDQRERLEAARLRMREAAQLWDLLRSGTATPAQLRDGAEHIDRWKRIGCVFQGPNGLQMAFQPDTLMRAKCRYCGAISQGKKSSFLKARACPKCTANSELVLLGVAEKG